jgi:hypothetical protein
MGLAVLYVCGAAGMWALCQEAPLASFTGTIREITRNKLAIETAGSNVIEFDCTAKTRYFDGTKKLDRSALKPGTRVTVEARRGLNGFVEAVNVRLERLKSR